MIIANLNHYIFYLVLFSAAIIIRLYYIPFDLPLSTRCSTPIFGMQMI